MPYDPEKHDRRSTRLRGYDYTRPGAYFVTICVHERHCLFGEIIDGHMRLNEIGRIVEEEWRRSENLRGEIALDAYVIMPNHVHGIVVVTPSDAGAPTDPRGYDVDVGTGNAGGRGDGPVTPTTGRPHGPKPKSLGAIVAGFKASVTTRINRLRGTPGEKVWQRGYYDRIIRNEKEWRRTRWYIETNPARWDDDMNHPTRL